MLGLTTLSLQRWIICSLAPLSFLIWSFVWQGLECLLRLVNALIRSPETQCFKPGISDQICLHWYKFLIGKNCLVYIFPEHWRSQINLEKPKDFKHLLNQDLPCLENSVAPNQMASTGLSDWLTVSGGCVR